MKKEMQAMNMDIRKKTDINANGKEEYSLKNGKKISSNWWAQEEMQYSSRCQICLDFA
jgi:coenzyme F420-reducing hydrogenase beta subunit